MPVNIEINDGNFSFGPDAGFFYTVSKSLGTLLKVEADGTPVDSFPVTLSLLRNPVKELHYDGTFFWTLEDLPSDLGLVIKRWRLFPFKTAAFPNVSPSEFRWQDELTLIHLPNMRWAADAFAIEHYHRELDGSFTQGATSIRLNNVSKIQIGDILHLGPSDSGGFEGNEEQITVLGISGNDISFFKPGGLENSYISQDPVDFVQGIFLFNDHGFSGREDNGGTLVKFAYPEKTQAFSDSGGKYTGVTAADFDSTTLSWVRAFQIIQLDIDNPTFDLNSSSEANLVEQDKGTLIEVFDLISDLGANLYYKLQQKETTEDLDTGTLTTVDYTPKFNFQTISILPFVNSVALEMPDTRFTEPFASGDTISITTYVRDQFNFPVFNKTVQFSATINPFSNPGVVGTFNPVQGITNASGIVNTVYTPSVTQDEILVDVQAEVL
jgi:hypothetical protein